jgi:hypothetical protein
MVHTNPEFETSSLILDFEFDQHLGSHKHVINIVMRFRDMGCYNRYARLFFMLEARGPQGVVGHVVAPEPTSAGRQGLEP